jgi:hypothetical protein
MLNQALRVGTKIENILESKIRAQQPGDPGESPPYEKNLTLIRREALGCSLGYPEFPVKLDVIRRYLQDLETCRPGADAPLHRLISIRNLKQRRIWVCALDVGERHGHASGAWVTVVDPHVHVQIIRIPVLVGEQ